MLSYYLRKKHEKQYGLATNDGLNASAEGTLEPPGGDALINVEGSESEGSDGEGSEEVQNETNMVHEQVPVEGCDTGSVEPSTSMIAGPLLNWYRQSRGLVLTRERMDSLLHLLQAIEPSLPRQVRTLERREMQQNPDEFAVNNMKRSIVCGGCALCEIKECVSQCKLFVSRAFH